MPPAGCSVTYSFDARSQLDLPSRQTNWRSLAFALQERLESAELHIAFLERHQIPRPEKPWDEWPPDPDPPRAPGQLPVSEAA